MSGDRFIHSGGDLLWRGARFTSDEFRAIQLIADDEAEWFMTEGDYVAASKATLMASEIGEALKAQEQWRRCAEGVKS